MLYIEAPVGVGFSYSESGNYKCDDDRTANENLAAVKSFFEMFPEYKQNKFFITGESYAGVYVPTLAEAIVNDVAVCFSAYVCVVLVYSQLFDFKNLLCVFFPCLVLFFICVLSLTLVCSEFSEQLFLRTFPL
jgi:carboxypeptidase C (cathepsin A)